MNKFLSPYVYVGDNPIKRYDPNGMDWGDEESKNKAEKIKAEIAAKNVKIEKKNTNLREKITRAEEKGNTKKTDKLNAKLANNNTRMDVNSQTMGAIDNLTNSDKTFSFGNNVKTKEIGDGDNIQTKTTTTFARKSDGTYIINNTLSSSFTRVL